MYRGGLWDERGREKKEIEEEGGKMREWI